MINPMLAKSAKEPFDHPDYLFEIKWDGERAIAFVENGRIKTMLNRRGNDVTRQFPEIVGQEVMADSAILDGEIVLFDDRGVPSFSKLSQRTHLQDSAKIRLISKNLPCNYIVFDVLEANGIDITPKPLTYRKEILSAIIPNSGGLIGISWYIRQFGKTAFEVTVNAGHEGIMAKKADGKYEIGRRSDSWLKIKPVKHAVVVVTGYTKGNGARESLGALTISEEVNGQLIDRGRVGSGLSSESINSLLTSLREIGKTGDIIKVEPTVKIKISYFEQTEAGHYRFPTFKQVQA